MKYDALKMYFGEPYPVTLPGGKTLMVEQPSIGDIVKIGQDTFLRTLMIFTARPSAYKVALWDMGIDWTEFSDFKLFMMFMAGIDNGAASLFIKQIPDWVAMKPYEDSGGNPVLYDPESGIAIDDGAFSSISGYMRAVFRMPEKEKKVSGALKKWYVDRDRKKLERVRNGLEKEEDASLQPIISACVNHPGFKYRLNELREVRVGEFYDSVERLQIYEQASACLKGLYSGMIDGKKISPEEYNFMRPPNQNKEE